MRTTTSGLGGESSAMTAPPCSSASGGNPLVVARQRRRLPHCPQGRAMRRCLPGTFDEAVTRLPSPKRRWGDAMPPSSPPSLWAVWGTLRLWPAQICNRLSDRCGDRCANLSAPPPCRGDLALARCTSKGLLLAVLAELLTQNERMGRSRSMPYPLAADSWPKINLT